MTFVWIKVKIMEMSMSEIRETFKLFGQAPQNRILQEILTNTLKLGYFLRAKIFFQVKWTSFHFPLITQLRGDKGLKKHSYEKRAIYFARLLSRARRWRERERFRIKRSQNKNIFSLKYLPQSKSASTKRQMKEKDEK